MLSIQGNVDLSRRELLSVGDVALMGLSLPNVLRHEAHAQTQQAAIVGRKNLARI